MGLVAVWHVVSSWTRDQTCVPCISRQILKQESPKSSFFTHHLSLSLTHTHRLIYLSITFYILLTIYFLLTTRWCCFLLHYHGKLTIVYSEMQPNILFIAWAIQLRIFEWFNQCGLWHWRWKQMDNSILTVVQFLALGRELSLEMKPLPQEWVFTKWLVKSYIICSV